MPRELLSWVSDNGTTHGARDGSATCSACSAGPRAAAAAAATAAGAAAALNTSAPAAAPAAAAAAAHAAAPAAGAHIFAIATAAHAAYRTAISVRTQILSLVALFKPKAGSRPSQDWRAAQNRQTSPCSAACLHGRSPA
eukprot:362745-Chlamydomonas_euryale.AAC.5